MRLRIEERFSRKTLPHRFTRCSASRMRTNRPSRQVGVSYVGFQRYFLTICTAFRARTFEAADTVEEVHRQFLHCTALFDFEISAYCYMPDHAHFLAEGKADDSDCLRFIARAKQFFGFHYKARFNQRLWQRYGYEHTLRSHEAAISVARYILENPVRVGLVARIEDYSYSGSTEYTLEQILEAVQMQDGWYRRSG